MGLPAGGGAHWGGEGRGYLGQFYFMGLFAQRVVKDLRRELFLRLTALSPSQLSKERVGDLLSRFSTDMTAVEWAAMYTVGSYLRDSLQVLVLAGVALSMSPLLGGLMLLVIPLAALPASRLTRKALQTDAGGPGPAGPAGGAAPRGAGRPADDPGLQRPGGGAAPVRGAHEGHEKAVVQRGVGARRGAGHDGGAGGGGAGGDAGLRGGDAGHGAGGAALADHGGDPLSTSR